MGRPRLLAYGELPMGTSWTFGEPPARAGLPERLLALIATVVLAGALAAPMQGQTGAQVAASRMIASADRLVEVIVQAVGDDDARLAEQSVTTIDGDVGQRLDIVGGFVAEVPSSRVGELSTAPGVLSVTPNGRVQLQSAPSVGNASGATSQLSHVSTPTAESS